MIIAEKWILVKLLSFKGSKREISENNKQSLIKKFLNYMDIYKFSKGNVNFSTLQTK